MKVLVFCSRFYREREGGRDDEKNKGGAEQGPVPLIQTKKKFLEVH